MSRTSYPPTDYTAVLSAMRGLTTEFGMGSGDPSLYGSAHTRHSPYMNLIYEVIRLRIFAHPEGHSVMGKNHESKRNNQDKELDQLVLLA